MNPPPQFGQPIVVARPGAIDAALEKAKRSRRSVALEVRDRYGAPGRAHTLRLFAEPGYGIAKDKAERIADVIGVPVAALFVHKDGTPLT